MDNKFFYQKLSLSDEIKRSWQETADLIAVEEKAAAVIIVRFKDEHLNLAAASGSDIDDLIGDQSALKINDWQYKLILDSENFTVYSSLKNNMWKNSIPFQKGFDSCAGYSIRWPNESIFGFLYIFHKKKKNYSNNDKKRILKYRELIETQLKLMVEKIKVKKYEEEKNTILSVTQKIDKKYKSVFNNITQGLSINEVIFRDQTPSDYVVRNYNPAYKNLLGLKDINKIMGKTGSEIYQKDEPSLLELYKEAVYEERNIKFDHYFGRLDKYFEITLTVLEKGKFITIFRDITKARKNNLKLQAANEQLTAYNQEILRMNNELDQSINELNEMNRRFITMIKTISGLKDSVEMSEDKFYSDLLKNALIVVPEADYGKIYVIEDDRCRLIDAVGHDIEIIKNIRFDKKLLFHYDSKEVFITDDYSLDVDKIPNNMKIKILNALKPIKSSLYINILAEQRIVGRIALDIAAKSEKEFSKTTQKTLQSFATLASSFFAFKKYDSLQDRFTKELISSIIKILEMYDFYTKGHSENVANLSLQIAEEMGYSKKTVWDAYWAGMVHDIGKLLIPLEILNKKSKLTDEEYDLIKKHPIWGSKALANSESLRNIAEYILYHHEKWNGRGYPEGLKKDEIPVISQIIAVADAWDAMTSKRSYRDSLTQKEAFLEIKRNKGRQFSPKAVDAFMRIIQAGKLKKGEQIYQN
ncbi:MULTISPECIES: HD-GYP domain-containing protein [unclassified Halanaerobium]|uniref:HD-GYP domain-containing protein n=1 Tax=unclassified Halanaerobium TaxID=2641197 RepID=UPI000E15784F|nr:MULTISPECIES: HD-GYP domain-containing protein [unclassified Halanaerobium]RCW40614.1 HD-GYP domain-containing protein (c-di-GMP phosphodiesterase class II) [Halanaerobium sp. MA284_MarDTE_T2]RCW87988.1 HD-GYP domain-containing protein (c-di-GMP phosphodiesterase class II) [Halanaerobium sp. DL-01]